MSTIGLQRGIAELVPYNPEWPKLFQEEKILLEKMLGEYVRGIEHIGSTAIPGIMAKPLIDIAVGIDMSRVEQVKTILEANGWIWRPKFGDIKEHIVFAKGNEQVRTHYLHVMQYGGRKWKEKIAFRDYLNTHETERKEYERLKIKAAEEFGDDRAQYTAEKDGYVMEVLKKAGFPTTLDV